MSNTSNITPIRPANPIEAARQALIKGLSELSVPGAFPTYPHPSCFTVVADHVREATRLFDEWLASIGHEVSDNAICKIDMRDFLTAFTDGADNAFYACERASEALYEDAREVMGGR